MMINKWTTEIDDMLMHEVKGLRESIDLLTSFKSSVVEMANQKINDGKLFEDDCRRSINLANALTIAIMCIEKQLKEVEKAGSEIGQKQVVKAIIQQILEAMAGEEAYDD